MVNDDATLLPTRQTRLVCPECRRTQSDGGAAYTQGVVGAVPRCPEHGHAFVPERDLEKTTHARVLGKTVGGRFTLLSVLGSGSMGAVYRARQEAVGRDVAVKVVRTDRMADDETRARFEREARATSLLTSPHTVTVFDFGEAEGDWFLVMELLEGESLGQRLRRTGALSVGETVRIAREALRSLAEAHSKGIIHRDLKPDNLFLCEPAHAGAAPICKVLDFGIAKVVREDARVDQLETLAGTVFGTPRYMSPEQAQGATLDPRTDLYSLGVILFQMLTGRPPFCDDDAVVVMARHIKDDPPAFAEVAPDALVPTSIENVVRRALAKAAEDRPQSAEQFMAALDDAAERAGVNDSGLLATAVAPMPRLRPSLRRRITYVLGAAALGGLAIAGYRVTAASTSPAASAALASPMPRAVAAAPAPAPAFAPQPSASAFDEPDPAAAASVAKPKVRRIPTVPAPRPVASPKIERRYDRFE